MPDDRLDALIASWHRLLPPKRVTLLPVLTPTESRKRLLDTAAERDAHPPGPADDSDRPTANDADRTLAGILSDWGIADPAYPGFIDRSALVDRMFVRLATDWPGSVPRQLLFHSAEAVRAWWVGHRLPAALPTRAEASTLGGAGGRTATAIPAVAAFGADQWDELRRENEEFYRVSLLVFAGRTPAEIAACLGVPPERIDATVEALAAA